MEEQVKKERKNASWFVVTDAGDCFECKSKKEVVNLIAAHGSKKVIKGHEHVPTTETTVIVKI